MGKTYDDWERLVEAVLLREKLRRLALCHSREPSSISDASSRFSFSSTTSQFDDPQLVSINEPNDDQETSSTPRSLVRLSRTSGPSTARPFWWNKLFSIRASPHSTTMENPFGRLSDDCVSEILSRTSPLDASRFAVISKGFKSSADSDTVWDRFIPIEVVSRSATTPMLVDDTKKSLYLSLCDNPILLDGGQLSFSLDKRSGKKCFMLGARELIIAWGETEWYWKWTSHANSRFSEVAHLNSVCWLDVRGKINTRLLSQKTAYSAYLVYQLANAVYGLESVFSVIRFVDQEADKDAEERASLLHLHRGHPMYRSPTPRQTGQLPVQRDDGWLEIEMGEFYNDEGDDGEVESRLLEIWRLHGKSGLIVEGIEFRPNTSSAYRQTIPRA